VVETVKEHKYPELYAAVCLLANLLDAYTVAFFLADQKGETLSPVASFSMSKSFRASDVGVGEGLVGRVYAGNKVVDMDRYEQSSKATGLYSEDEGIKAFLGMPVGRAGVLVVDSNNRRTFGEKEKKHVRDMAGFIWHLLEGWRVRDRERQYGRILDLLYAVENATLRFDHPKEFYRQVLEAGARFTGLPLGFLCLAKPETGRFVVEAVHGKGISTMRGNQYPADSGLVGLVFQSGRTLYQPNARPLKGKSFLITSDEPIREYDAFMGVPLSCWHKFLGVWAYAGIGGRPMEDEDENGLMVAGHRVAATIEHYGLSQARKA